MVKVGITGGIGSGKSLICKMFSLLNVPIYYADDRAKEIINSDKEIKRLLTEKFGESLYLNGTLNRVFLAEIIFSNKEAINFVNSIVHPAVNKDFNDWVTNSVKTDYCIEEAALIFESGSYKKLDLVITVVCPEQMRIINVMKRDKVNREYVLSRMQNQWPDKEKINLSDFIIYNDNSVSLIEQVNEIHNKILMQIKNG